MMDTQKTGKKWILHTTVFLIVFVLLFIQLSYLFRLTSVNRESLVGYYAEPENSLDVVLIGGSSTLVFWMPYEAYHDSGFTSYCFSANSMSPALLKGMLVEAQKRQSPELFIVDLRAFDVKERRPWFYSESRLRNITDSLRYSANRTEMIQYAYAVEQPHALKDPSIYLDFMLYHSRWKKLSYDEFQYAKGPVENENRGFSFHTNDLHTPLEHNDYSAETGILPLTESDAVLRDLLDYCKEARLNVLFLLNPFFMDDADFAQRYNYISDVIRDYGFPFLDTNDYYEEMGIDFSRDFYNRDHTNVLGAQKYTRFLTNYLVENYDLPDRRDDPNYISWKNGYPAWNKRLQENQKLVEDAIANYGLSKERG